MSNKSNATTISSAQQRTLRRTLAPSRKCSANTSSVFAPPIASNKVTSTITSSQPIQAIVEVVSTNQQQSAIATELDISLIPIVDVDDDYFEFVDLTKENDDFNATFVHEVKQILSSNTNEFVRPNIPRPDLESTINIDDDKNDTAPPRMANQSSSNQATRLTIATNIFNESISSPFKRQRLAVPTIAHNNQAASTVATTSSISSNTSGGGKKTELCCPVCLESLDELKSHNKILMATFCGHIICNKCVDQHFKAGKEAGKTPVTCPTCRKKLARNNIHIFNQL